jgi:hypothetical protein
VFVIFQVVLLILLSLMAQLHGYGLGVMCIASDVGRDRPFFAPDALMWSVNWPSCVCLITASILLLFVAVRSILRALQR